MVSLVYFSIRIHIWSRGLDTQIDHHQSEQSELIGFDSTYPMTRTADSVVIDEWMGHTGPNAERLSFCDFLGFAKP